MGQRNESSIKSGWHPVLLRHLWGLPGSARRHAEPGRDNDEELAYTHDGDSGLLCIDATGYPYGVDRVVRVAEVR